jgi:nicotinate-nucleotide pyrophosphorylase (carboxylating)
LSVTSNKDRNTDISRIIKVALLEDAPRGDITSLNTVPKDTSATGHVISRGSYVVSGIDVTRQVYLQVDKKIKFTPFVKNGQMIKKGQRLYSVKGNARSILLAERTALNILSHMMGVATRTKKFVELIKDTRAVILDTRKTVPGMRALQRQAVRDGGGRNHRYSLSDAILVKENHIAMCGGIKKVLQKLSSLKDAGKSGAGKVRTEIEVRSLDELKQILNSKFKPDIVMLDNMTPATVKKAVAINRNMKKGRVELEVSGGVNEKTIRAYAKTGVDYISLGTLTHSVQSADLSFLFK